MRSSSPCATHLVHQTRATMSTRWFRPGSVLPSGAQVSPMVVSCLYGRSAVGPLVVNCSDRRSMPRTAGTSADRGFRAGRRGGGACNALPRWFGRMVSPNFRERYLRTSSALAPLACACTAFNVASPSDVPFACWPPPALGFAPAAVVAFATRLFLGFSAATPFPPNRFRARSATSNSSSWPLSFVRSASTRVSRSEMRCLCCAI